MIHVEQEAEGFMAYYLLYIDTSLFLRNRTLSW